MQTEHHGYIQIEKIIRRESQINRKFSSNTAIGFINHKVGSKTSDNRISESARTEFK